MAFQLTLIPMVLLVSLQIDQTFGCFTLPIPSLTSTDSNGNENDVMAPSSMIKTESTDDVSSTNTNNNNNNANSQSASAIASQNRQSTNQELGDDPNANRVELINRGASPPRFVQTGANRRNVVSSGRSRTAFPHTQPRVGNNNGSQRGSDPLTLVPVRRRQWPANGNRFNVQPTAPRVNTAPRDPAEIKALNSARLSVMKRIQELKTHRGWTATPTPAPVSFRVTERLVTTPRTTRATTTTRRTTTRPVTQAPPACLPVATGSVAPTINYSEIIDTNGKYEVGTLAALTCPGLGTTNLLVEGSNRKAYASMQALTCLPNGQWSSQKTFHCRQGCVPMGSITRDYTTFAYTAPKHGSLYAPGTMIRVNCKNRGTETTLYSSADEKTPIHGRNDVQAICEAGGVWKFNQTIANAFNCYANCEPHMMPFQNTQPTFEGMSTGSVTHGDSIEITLNGAATPTMPCDYNDPTRKSVLVGITNEFADGTHGQFLRESGSKHKFTCFDGEFRTTVIDPHAGVQTGPVFLVNCY